MVAKGENARIKIRLLYLEAKMQQATSTCRL